MIPGNDLLVARTASAWVYPDIASSITGNVVVTWLDTSHVYDRLLRPTGYGFKFSSMIRMPFFVDELNYCSLAASNGDCGGDYGQGGQTSFAYYRANDTSGRSFSWQMYEEYGCIGGGYNGTWSKFANGYKIHRMITGNTLYFIANEDVYLQEDWRNYGRGAYLSILTVDRTTGNTARISSYYQKCSNSFDWGIMGYPWLLITNEYEGRHATILRKIEHDGNDYWTHILYSLHDTTGNTHTVDLPIDTLGVRETYRTEQIALTSDRLILAHRKYRGDTLLVDVYDTSGTIIQRDVDTRIRLFPVRDFVHESEHHRGLIQIKMAALPGDRIAVVWTGPYQGSGNALYVQIFDDDMKSTSGPNRINTDTAGLQVYPNVAVRSDTICVVWANEHPDGTRDVYMKSFSVDDVTSRPPLQVPETLSLTAFPNPATSTVQVQLEGYRDGAIECEVFNLLGSSVWYSQSETGSFTIPTLPPGYYRVRALSDGAICWTAFVVR